MQEKKNAELPKLRIESSLFEKVQRCLDSINEQAKIQIPLSEFRRMALKHFTEKVLREGLTIEFKPVK